VTARKASGRGERTRAKLLDAARGTFAERGFAATRVDDIVSTAGTSHGTFYLYFTNKDDVLRALAESTAADARELGLAFEAVVVAADRESALKQWVASFFELYRRDWAVLQAWIQAEASAPELDILGRTALADVVRAMASAIREAHGSARHATIAATALVAMLERLAYFWVVREARFREADVVDTLAAIIHGAVFEPAVAARPSPRVRRA
jgi:AcrR family transcriptional regulator